MSNRATAAQSNDWLCPTWGRGLIAAVVAAGAFCLPQEVPVVWYPLNHPGQDILYLEISCAADKTGEVQIYYDVTQGMNELHSIRFPISPTTETYTYTFPLLDAPITGFWLKPVVAGGGLTIRQMRIIDRRGTEQYRFTQGDFVPTHQISQVATLIDGWKITSEPEAHGPSLRIVLDAPLIAKGMNDRNLLRCLLSTGYLAGMLLILLLAILFTFYRPLTWRGFFAHLGFLAAIGLAFAAVGNRGLIKNSVRYAQFSPPIVVPGFALEVYLAISRPLTAQLFWDQGRGFNEADSLRFPCEPTPRLQTVRFKLPAGPLTALRFDPLDGEARIVIREIRIVDLADRVRATLPLEALSAFQDIGPTKLEAGSLRFETLPGRKDPILLFSPTAVSTINRVLAGQAPP